ncbi:hypothetical protein P879_01313 [Paragonimus westermani]|uniref:Tetratricopeptide repeat protein 5 OB fold domain-containing protein n=1 Tax=Paragonimus westermani TaxID=34504 RepID=A0A8T0DGM2_9TREM|nr:hypothetical protein P879_01313 [Paragonimus westermani]
MFKLFRLATGKILCPLSSRLLFSGCTLVSTCSATFGVLCVRAEPSETPLLDTSTPLSSSTPVSKVFARCVQWQLDASLCLVHQLLREYESSLNQLLHLVDVYAKLLTSFGPNSDPSLDDQLVVTRSMWSECANRLDEVELTVQSGLNTLRSSLETCFMCEGLIDRGVRVLSEQDLPGQNLSAQGSGTLHHAESEFTRLRQLRKQTVERWHLLLTFSTKQPRFIAMENCTDIALALSRASEAVQNLIQFRSQFVNEMVEQYDIFSENDQLWNSSERLDNLIVDVRKLFDCKAERMRKVFEATLTTLKQMEPLFARASSLEKSKFCYLNGKALNAIQSDMLQPAACETDCTAWTSQAVLWLTRALKFNPQCADSWCELGESCWRQGHPAEAINHFRQALKIAPSHVDALCQLSMALRQLPSSAQPSANHGTSTASVNQSPSSAVEKDHLTESLQLAHEAVRHSPTNGHAWSVLGNALLTTYFEHFAPTALPSVAGSQSGAERQQANSETTQPVQAATSSQRIMSRCIAAYAQAAKDLCTALEPNFHFNRGIAWHYQDMYANSLRSWLRAICLDPQWCAPRTCALRLVQFILELVHGVDQLRRELNGTCTGVAGDAYHGAHEEHKLPMSHTKRLRDLIAPLAPCLHLLALVNDRGHSEQLELSAAVKPTTESSKLTGQQRSAVTRLLGPYWSPASGDPAATSLLTGTRKHKGKRGKSRRSLPPSCPLTTRPLQLSLFDDLKVGQNMGKVCVGRVVNQLPSDSELVLNLLLLDAQGSPMAVRLCNIGKGLGPVRKDTVAIPHPFVEECEIPGCLLRAVLRLNAAFDTPDEPLCKLLNKLNELHLVDAAVPVNETSELLPEPPTISNMSLQMLRVPIPDILVVNGQPVGSSWTAAPILKHIFFTAV